MGFRENLKSELTYQDILVKELAEKTGIPKRSLDNYLREKGSIPPADYAVLIAKALNTTVEYLVTGINLTEKEANLEKCSLLFSKMTNDDQLFFIKLMEAVLKA